MAYYNTHPLRPICRKCEYRRLMAYRGYATGPSHLHGCLYILVEGKPRGCTPTDTYCEKFKPRQRKKPIGNNRKIIK